MKTKSTRGWLRKTNFLEWVGAWTEVWHPLLDDSGMKGEETNTQTHIHTNTHTHKRWKTNGKKRQRKIEKQTRIYYYRCKMWCVRIKNLEGKSGERERRFEKI